VSASIAAASCLTSSRAFGADGDPALQQPWSASGTPNSIPPAPSEYHGFSLATFEVEGCKCFLASSRKPLAGRPWVWRTMFWNAFPAVDLALLDMGFHLGFIDVGNTFGAPEPMKHFDAFHETITHQYGLAYRPALEGLSRGGLYAYRWASMNPDKLACIYADAPVCDMKSWPGGKGRGNGSPKDWDLAIEAYHFESEQQMMDFKGNPIDILAPLVAAHVPVLHVCGDQDRDAPIDENTDVLGARYTALGGSFAFILKQGCAHHPHSLKDPRPIVDFIASHCAQGREARRAKARAPQPGSLLLLAEGAW